MKKTAAILSLCLLMGSCNQNQQNGENNQTCNKCSESSDWGITTKVKTSIMTDSSLSTSSRLVHIETTNGVVTLTGSVPSKEDSRRIERLAKEVQGVKKVQNQLTVNP